MWAIFAAAWTLLACAGCAAQPPLRGLTDEERASPATLSPGDPAPPLAVSAWLRGPGVTAFEPGTIYVIDCWASWCGPCLASMPHAAELATRYAGELVVVALSTCDPDNDPGDIRKAVAHIPPPVRVAIDDGVTTAERYRVAVRDVALPRAFLVDRTGTLAWWGHPRDLDGSLAGVVEGRWDLDAAAAHAARRDRAAIETRALARRYLEATAAGDSAAALEAATAACAYPVEFVDGLSPPNWAWTTQVRLLAGAGRGDEAIAAARQAAVTDGVRDDPVALARLSAAVAPLAPDDASRFAEQAIEAVEAIEGERLPGIPGRAEQPPPQREEGAWADYIRRASALSNAAALAEVAAVEAELGRPAQAAALQRIALARWPADPRLRPTRAQLEDALARYEAAAAR